MAVRVSNSALAGPGEYRSMPLSFAYLAYGVPELLWKSSFTGGTATPSTRSAVARETSSVASLASATAHSCLEIPPGERHGLRPAREPGEGPYPTRRRPNASASHLAGDRGCRRGPAKVESRGQFDEHLDESEIDRLGQKSCRRSRTYARRSSARLEAKRRGATEWVAVAFWRNRDNPVRVGLRFYVSRRGG
jgi:hypothetical protein